MKITLYKKGVGKLVKFKHLFRSSFYLFGGGEFAYVISPPRHSRLDYGDLDYGAVFGGGIELKKLTPLSFIEIRSHIGYKANTISLVLGI